MDMKYTHYCIALCFGFLLVEFVDDPRGLLGHIPECRFSGIG